MLGIFLEGLLVLLSHRPKLFSVRAHIQILLVLVHKSFTQIVESSDICTVQAHVPLQSGTSQTVLEVMDQDFMIIGMCRHLPRIHYQMHFRASIPLIFFKIWDFELVRYLDIRYQEEIISILSEQFLSN